MTHPSPQTLSSIMGDVGVIEIHGNPDVMVSSITYDSRNARHGAVFVAYHGVYQDTHRYIADAVAHGASAVVVERPFHNLFAAAQMPEGVTVVRVRRARRARSALACALFGNPASDMTVVGVTGTDGKTTTSTLIHAIVSAAGRRSGLISTVAADLGGRAVDTGLHTTTPEPEDLHGYLADMRESGVDVAVIEATSHGLAQDRVTHVAFDVAVVTNVTREALEYHETMDAYLRAKSRLFHLAAIVGASGGLGTSVLNRADPSYARLSRIGSGTQLTYDMAGDADFTARDVELAHDGLSFTADTPRGSVRVRTSLLGSYNIANVLAAMAATHALDVGADAWVDGVASVHGIPGRMEIVDEGQDFLAIVDFAHTPNAIASALRAARDMRKPPGRVIAVFGSAGLRDQGKRLMMGRAAGDHADVAIVTAEDPRTEDLDAILQEIAEGLRAAGAREGHEFALVPDRFRAIRRACAMAGPGDVVLVAGKGHEQSMCFGEVEYPWDDRTALRAALRGEAYGRLPTA